MSSLATEAIPTAPLAAPRHSQQRAAKTLERRTPAFPVLLAICAADALILATAFVIWIDRYFL